MLRSADPGQSAGRKDVTVSELLDAAVAALDKGVDPSGRRLEYELVQRIRRTAAIVYFWQGYADKGRDQAQKMLEAAEAQCGSESLDVAKAIDVLVGWYWFGRTDPAEGERLTRRAIAIYERAGLTDDQSYRDALHSLNLMLHAQRRIAEAMEIAATLAQQYDAMADPPIVAWETAHHDVANNGLGLGRAIEGLPHIQRCIEICRTRLPPDRVDTYVARPYATLANFMLALDRPAEAEEAARLSMEIHDRLRGPDHPYPMYERRVLISALIANDKLDEAEERLREYERLLVQQGRQPGVDEMANRARLLRRRGHQQQAMTIWQSLAQYAFEGPNPPLQRGDPVAADAIAEWLGCFTDVGQAAEGLTMAAPHFEATRSNLATTGNDTPQNVMLRRLASAMLRAYEAIGDEPSLDAASRLRERYPGLTPAPGFEPAPVGP
jgi:tetratricopeptide (TPR) repeat protein